MKKVKFIRDFSPRKKGAIVELDVKLADYYISIGVAVSTEEDLKEVAECSDCKKNLTVSETADLINAVESIEDLEQFKTDKRQGVQKVLKAKIKELETE